MGPVPWGGKPGYEDRKADLEAKLAEQPRRSIRQMTDICQYYIMNKV